jgi:hypothetical protein
MQKKAPNDAAGAGEIDFGAYRVADPEEFSRTC